MTSTQSNKDSDNGKVLSISIWLTMIPKICHANIDTMGNLGSFVLYHICNFLHPHDTIDMDKTFSQQIVYIHIKGLEQILRVHNRAKLLKFFNMQSTTQSNSQHVYNTQ